MNRKKLDLIIKIILTILALVSAVLTFAVQWPGKETVIVAIYGVLYFITALTLWFENKRGWIRVIMIASMVITIIFTIAQAVTGIPLGIYMGEGIVHSLIIVLLASPGILGLIYFNLGAQHNNLDLLLIFMRIILNFEIGIIAFLLIVMLEVSGALIWSFPEWGQYVFVYGILLLVILDMVYAIINWLNFYHGRVTWITTSLVIIEVLACTPLFGVITFTTIVFVLIIIAILIFTAYLNNHIKSKKALHK